MSKTDDNLKTMFAGKSQTNQKYRLYAKKARREGFPNVARLFKLTSEAEKIQAERNLVAFSVEKSTLENLKTAIAGKMNKYKKAYPQMLEQAITDKHKAKLIFEKAVKLEQAHSRLYRLAFKSLKKGEDLSLDELFLCPRCSNIETSKPHANCSICNAAPDKFISIGI